MLQGMCSSRAGGGAESASAAAAGGGLYSGERRMDGNLWNL